MDREKRDLHDASCLLTDAGLQKTARGGCVESPRIQGCATTASTSDVPIRLLKGGREDASEFRTLPVKAPYAATGGERTGLNTSKRMILLLNVSPQPQTSVALDAAGITVVPLRRFGTLHEPTTTLMAVKRAIREGRVLWLHGRVKPQHWTKPTWFTQCCRLAHRATAQWTLEFTRSPWHVKPFEALRRHKYVQDLGAAETSSWFGSE